MKFIHCADLHIAKSQNGEEIRYEDFIGALKQIADAAIKENAGFIIVSGDLFDTKSVLSGTLWRVSEILMYLREKGVKVFVIEGNHDRAYYFEKGSWLYFLNNMELIILLKPDFIDADMRLEKYDGRTGAIYEGEDYTIIGLGYFGAFTKKRLEEACCSLKKNGKFTILMLHAALRSMFVEDLSGVEKEALVKAGEIADYIALGHIHKRYESEGLIYNPGSPEFIGSDEARRKDKKGFYVFDTAAKEKKFIETKTRAHIFAQADISGVTNKEQVREKVIKAVEEAGEAESAVIEIDLTGETPIETYLFDTALMETELKEKYGAVSVSVTTYLVNSEKGTDISEEAIDRREMERGVMRRIMKDTGYDNAFAEHMTDFAMGIKNNIGRFESGETADAAEALAELKAGFEP